MPQPQRKSPRNKPKKSLHYVDDQSCGISRIRKGKHFIYLSPQGQTVTDERTLDRIRGLVIPPAWRDVWICRLPNGHLQATGRDARGRKQYRYHPLWSTMRNERKFDRLSTFGRRLPMLRRK